MLTRILSCYLGAAVVLQAQTLENRLDGHVLSYVTLGQFSGAVLVARDGQPILRRGYGLANREWNLANTPDTKFRLGSVTKQFAAALTVKLEEMGKLRTDDPVCKYVPDCPEAWQKVTIHHLLTHSSGIPSFTSFPDYVKTMHAPSPPKETLARFRDKPLEFEPGSKFAYNNSGYVLLGYILEIAAGKSFEEALRELILAPLAMNDTGYDWPANVVRRRAAGYSGAGDNAAFIDMTIPHAAGAMYSTVDDLWKWSEALGSNPVLSAASWGKMFTPAHQNYAYGLDVGPEGSRKRLAHGGGINGFSSFVARYPEERLTVVVLGNTESAKSGPIAQELARIVFGEPVEVPRAREERKIDPGIFDAYVGSYELAPNFILRFWREGDVFWTQATGQPKAQLFAESESKFFLKVVDAQVSFVKGEDGQVTHLILHQGGDQKAKRLP